MNWFGSLIVGFIGSFLSMISALLIAMGSNVPQVVLGNLMSNPHLAFGTGNFFDVIPNGHNAIVMQPFIQVFVWLAYAFMVFAAYIGAANIARANNSSIQRDRLKNEIVGWVVAVLFLFAGPYLAVAITQLSWDMCAGLFSLSGANSLSVFTIGSKGVHPSSNPATVLFHDIVQFISVLMGFFINILYKFRGIFLDVWVILFPFAMASYANEKTKGIFKLWWTEWIFQMLVPLGQSLVYSLAMGMVNITGASSSSAVGLGDIFTSIAGVVGFLAAGAYVRKFVDVVAQEFKAPMMGNDLLGGLAAGAVAGYATDTVAGASIKAASFAPKQLGKAGFRALDKRFAGAAMHHLHKNPETVASALAHGQSFEDVMAARHTQKGEPIANADGMGIVSGTDSRQSMGDRLAGRGNGSVGGSLPSSYLLGRGIHPGMAFHSSTLGALRSIPQGMKNELQASNMAVIAQAKMADLTNSQWAKGKYYQAGEKLGAHAFPRFQAQHATWKQQQGQMKSFRDQLRHASELNAAQKRMANISGDTYEPFAPGGAAWSGNTANMERYNTSKKNLEQVMPKHEHQSVEDTLGEYEDHWRINQDHEDVNYRNPAFQKAYQQAKQNYLPFYRDTQARDMVQGGHIQFPGAIRKEDGKLSPSRVKPEQSERERLELMMSDLRSGRLHIREYVKDSYDQAHQTGPYVKKNQTDPETNPEKQPVSRDRRPKPTNLR